MSPGPFLIAATQPPTTSPAVDIVAKPVALQFAAVAVATAASTTGRPVGDLVRFAAAVVFVAAAGGGAIGDGT